ncbi:hypothetical protein [Lacipirellula sp.]|uniref:hypothetical protein n=1 Tax=Lacipirellula sp. TaxID=2691419 RepID=UPI003D117877
MKPLYLLAIGVGAGWAASGVDWTHDVLAQNVLTDAPPATLQQDAPDAPPVPTSRAIPADGILDPSIPRPRRVYETRVTTDSNGARHSEVMSRLVNADGSIVSEPPPGLVGRFQATAYGSPSGSGCFVVDTMTGKTWHVAPGIGCRVLTEALTQSSAPPSSPSLAPMPSYNNEPSLPQRRSVVPTPKAELAEPESDAN